MESRSGSAAASSCAALRKPAEVTIQFESEVSVDNKMSKTQILTKMETSSSFSDSESDATSTDGGIKESCWTIEEDEDGESPAAINVNANKDADGCALAAAEGGLLLKEEDDARSLGDRVDSFSKLPRQQHSMSNVVFLMLTSLIAANALAYVIVETRFYRDSWHLRRRPTTLSSASNPIEALQGISKRTIPFIQDWYYRKWGRDRAVGDGEPPRLMEFKSGEESSNATTLALDAWFSAVEETSPSVSTKDVELSLKNMGLLNYFDVTDPLQSLLQHETRTNDTLQRSLACLKGPRALSNMATKVMEHFPHVLRHTMKHPTHKRAIEKAVAHSLVAETLVSSLQSDYFSLQHILENMKTKQRDRFLRLTEANGFPSEMRKSLQDGYDSALLGLSGYLNGISSNHQVSMATALQLGILERVKIDIERGFGDNARVGLALATFLSAGGASFEPSFENHKMTWPLGRNWIEGYLAWKMTFMLGSQRVESIASQLIPSISCELTNTHGENFMAMEILSHALWMMSVSEEDAAKDRSEDMNSEMKQLVTKLGKSNLHTLKLTSPSRDTVNNMMYTLCGQGKFCLGYYGASIQSTPLQRLDKDEFKLYLAFVSWITILISGFGLEILVLYSFLKGMATWSVQTKLQWKIAQFLFPLLCLVSVGLSIRGNYFALVTLVFGLWKFGFPECISYTFDALYACPSPRESSAQESAKKRFTRTVVSRIVDFLYGVGLVIHHGAASCSVAMLLNGVIDPTQEIIESALIPVMQHWAILLRYVNKPLYLAIELALEVWFEWSILANFEAFCQNHWMAAVVGTTMLFAHWMFVIAGVLEVAFDMAVPSGQKAIEQCVKAIKRPPRTRAPSVVEDRTEMSTLSFFR